MTVVSSKFERKANELYETEEWATRALLRNLPALSGKRVWEPAAGNHKIADVLTHAGASVLTSDIATYGREHDGVFDFLSDGAPHFPSGVHDLITNPPYGRQNRIAVRFAEKALKRCDGWVALLLTAKFDSGKTRTHLLRDNPRFAFKVVLLDRIKWFPGDNDGTEDHAWFVWSPVGGQCGARLFYECREPAR